MSIILILDVIMITLLVTAIIYAVILDHHLSATKENYRMLSHLIEQFYQASQRMQDELNTVQQSENEMKQSLLLQIDKASVLKEELNVLLNKIEQKTHTLDGLKVRRPLTTQNNVLSDCPQDMDLSESEQELLNALNELK
ncbi:MAG: hypothetical protein IJY58_00430 [Alphaproteobacteria bacterium]|nr:hypothetical protein [Alphaproteobacteria bacterium]